MSQSGGKLSRDRKRRLSDPAPYKKPPKGPAVMPTTRHSPTRQASSQGAAEPSSGDVLRELALLRRSIESRFVESAEKVDSMKDELMSKLESNDQAVSEVQLAITDVTLSVDKNQCAIHEVRAEVERRELELPHKVKTIVQEALAKAEAARPAVVGLRPRPIAGNIRVEPSREDRSSLGSGDRKSEAYAAARKSIRLWPVSREGDLRERTVEFLVHELLLDQQYAIDLDFTVKRVGSPRSASAASGAGAGARDEVLLVFNSIRDRDDVRSHAKNLERRGRGLRLEVPDHLWPSFRALQNIGYELKQKHQSLKRNLLFDDSAEDLKLDVCINGTWKTIYPSGAREALAKVTRAPAPGRGTLSVDELGNLLAEDTENMDAEEF